MSMPFGKSTRTKRSPPQTDQGNSFKCQACTAADTDEMVQCDLCDRWYHFRCVQVDNTIENKDFLCPKCNLSHNSRGNTPAPSVKSSRASLRRKTELELRRLEEGRLSEERDQKYMEEKYKLLGEMESEDRHVSILVDYGCAYHQRTGNIHKYTN